MTDSTDQPEPQHRTSASSLSERLDAIAQAAVDEAAGSGTAIRVSYQLASASGPIAGRAADDEHYAASTMKLPLVLAAYRGRDQGRLDLDSMLTVHNSFTSRVGSPFGVDVEDDSDHEVWDAMGSQVSLRWLCRRSIIRSSNLATNLVLEAVGFDAVAEAIAACDAGDLRVVRMINDYAAQQVGRSNVVTAAGLNAVLAALAAGTAAEPATCREVLAILADNEVTTDVTQGLPEGTWVAHKNGWVSDAVLDAALIRPGGVDDPEGEFVLSAAVSGRWPNDRSHDVIGRLAAEAWAHRTAWQADSYAADVPVGHG
ncbi:serine hydrolase [Microlunatus soli]|uniref:Beta-lactamase class A n=1 Tax=Microlunatus soli TaxID=630515 RepID=A0A1H2AAA3_9ACTN|nr:serine hydrolase [Microlunatus soli]SDT42920.1 beta-lactamase class A [Microlunatus soli]